MVRYRHLFLSCALAYTTAFAVAQGAFKLTPDPLVIEPGQYSYVEFNGGRVFGLFKITDPRKDVVCLIFDEEGFINWQNHHQYKYFYDSGKVAVGSFKINLVPGRKHFLVFSNPHFLASSTVVVKASIVNVPYPKY